MERHEGGEDHMIRLMVVGLVTSFLMLIALSQTPTTFGQTATPTVSPTVTSSPSPSPTGSVAGASTTVPSGAPATGFGK